MMGHIEWATIAVIPRQAFCESALFDQHRHQVTSRDVLHDKVEVILILCKVKILLNWTFEQNLNILINMN